MPQTTIKKRFDRGYVDSRIEGDLRPGELTVATGVVYKPGDPIRAYKLDGRSQFGNTTTAAEVDGIAVCPFDAGGTDAILALSNNTLYYDAIADTDSDQGFDNSTAVTGDSLDTAHYNNRWYLAFGDNNKVLESDETLRDMGMKPPVEPLEISILGTTGTVTRPTTAPIEVAGSGTWTDSTTDGGDGYDGDLDSFLYTTLDSSSGASVRTIQGWVDDGLPNRFLRITWSLRSDGGSTTGATGDGGINPTPGWTGTVKIEVDEGAGFSTKYNATVTQNQPKQTLTIAVADATNLTNLKVKYTINHIKGITAFTFKLYDHKVYDTSDGPTFSLKTGIYYTFTEFDSTRGLESPPSQEIAFLDAADFQNKNAVKLTFPPSAQNSITDTYKIYRSRDGGTESELFYLDSAPSTEASYIDDFSVASFEIIPSNIPVGTLLVNQGGIASFYDRDLPPPNLRRITTFQGSLVGLTDSNTRALYYSVPGSPESWPAVNVIDSFNLPEHDELVDILEINGSLIVAGREVMLRVDELPRTVGGNFILSDIIQIKGAPGVVGDYAMAAVEYQGIAHAAWVSDEQGILITDGSRYRSISDDIDWHQFQNLDKTSWVLEWIPVINCLMFGYVDGTAPTQRYFLLSLDRTHLKEDGQAKVSGPHYGSINHLAQGRISSVFRVFSAHRSDGWVYEEFDWTTGADASSSFSGTQLPLTITTGREYGPRWTSYQALDGRVRFSDFGTGETGTINYTTTRDSSGVSATKSITSVDLATTNNIDSTQFVVRRTGEDHKLSLTHTADAGSNSLRFQRGSILDVDLRVIPLGTEGGKDSIA